MLLVTLANSECEMHCAVGFFDHREKLKLTQLSETPNRSQNLLSSTKLYTSSAPEPQPACGLARLPPNQSLPSDESLEPLQASSRPTQQISAWLFDCHPQHHLQSSSKNLALLQTWPHCTVHVTASAVSTGLTAQKSPFTIISLYIFGLPRPPQIILPLGWCRKIQSAVCVCVRLCQMFSLCHSMCNMMCAYKCNLFPIYIYIYIYITMKHSMYSNYISI